MSDSSTPSKPCVQCGAELAAEGTEGLCPRCLMAEAMQPTAPKATGPWQPPTPEELQELLPQYEVISLLGRGGMGAVYQGRQISLDRLVAIKIISNVLDEADASYGERFKNEARAMARLNHPGIVAVHDYGQTANGILYIVMEYIEGTDVARMIAQQKRLHTDHAMAITAHVCDALAYAHERGIIHRDIKPANIMVSNDGVVKVADFGLAKMTQSGDAGLTQSGMAMGTLHYMAPEALMLGSEVDHRADIYAVGVMLYQMLTGRVPHGIFELPSMQVAGLDPRYDAIIAQAMREDREIRFQTVRELRGRLDNILTQPVVQVDPEVTQAPAAVPPEMRAQRSAGQPYRPPQRQTVQRSSPPDKSSTLAWVAAVVVVLGVAVWLVFGLGLGRSVPDAETVAETPEAKANVAPTVTPGAPKPTLPKPGSIAETGGILEPKRALGKPFTLPYASMVKSIQWEGQPFQAQYLGILAVPEKETGKLPKSVRGLAFHPDGRLAFLEATGMSPQMGMHFWDSTGVGPPVVKLSYRPATQDAARRQSEESQGIFSNFGGQLAFDAAGDCFFSAGGTLRKVMSASPVLIDTWRPAGALIDGLQIPFFDRSHFYVTKANQIHRLSQAKSAGWDDAASEPWFSLLGTDVNVRYALVVSPSRVIIVSRVRLPEAVGGTGKFDLDSTLLFDRDEKACWSLPVDLFGPMAMSWDGRRLVRFDWVTKSIMEFSLPGAGTASSGIGSTAAPATQTPAAPRQLTPEWMDAMPLIDPIKNAQQTHRVVWTRTAAGLQSRRVDALSVYAGCLQIPVPLPPSYALEVEMTPGREMTAAGPHGIGLSIPVGAGSRSTCWIVADRSFAGLGKVDGKDPGETAQPGCASPFKLESGRRYKMSAEVRHASAEEVDVQFSMDGKVVGSYHGPTHRLSVSSCWNKNGDPKLADFGANDLVTLHSVKIKALPDTPAKSTLPASPTQAP